MSALHSSFSFFMRGNRRAAQYKTKLRRRFEPGESSLRLPLQQTRAQREETVTRVLAAKRGPSAVNSKAARLEVERRLFARGARLEREMGQQVNTMYAMQGLGDLEPLRNSRSFGFSEREALKYDSPRDALRYDPPPLSYTPLAARKLAEGNLWPRAPAPSDMAGVMSTELRYLRHPENMSPSARHFCDKLVYHIRRSLKACPPHIAERIDFSQVIIQEVLASRRSNAVYIVWKTVDPGARWEVEPHLLRLHYWIRRLVIEKMKSRPNIPREVHFVYDGDRVERELPRRLVAELKNHVGDVSSSLETRVQYLKSLDTVQHKLREIPWFMPYLWNKEEKAARMRMVREDVEEFERRRREARAATEAQAARCGRTTEPSMNAPPSYVR